MIKYLCLAISLLSSSLPASTDLTANNRAGFEKLRSLVGDWRGELPDGNFIDVSYQLINGGAILERYHSKDPMWWNMSSIYYLDVDEISMTHYCSWGNHPRMTAKVYQDEINQLKFLFNDISMTKPDNGYMRNLTFSFQDNDSFTHHWTWHEHGKETELLLDLKRK